MFGAKTQGFPLNPRKKLPSNAGVGILYSRTYTALAIVAGYSGIHSTCIYTTELSEPKGSGTSVPPGFGRSVNPI